MCRATLTFVLVLQLVPSLVLAQGASRNDHIDPPGAEAPESVTPSTGPVRSCLVALFRRTDGSDAPSWSGVSRRWGWLQPAANRNPPEGSVQHPGSQGRDWIGRHPALFGALAGAGGGAVAAATMENEWFCSGGDEDCFFHGGGRVLLGAGTGAGVGALVGWLAGLGSK